MKTFYKNWKAVVCSFAAILILIFYLLPLYWLFVNSLKTNIEIFRNPPTLWPQNIVFENYFKVFGSGTSNVLPAFLNSFVIAISTTLLSMLIALPAAYALAKFKIRFGKLFLLVFMIGQMLSPTVKLVPLFMTFRSLNIINSLFSVVIALCTYTIPFAILILRPFFLSIPVAIQESALMDGCNKFTSFIRVILPISYPGIIVAAVFNFLSGWNDLIYPLTFLTDQKKRPMIANIYTFIGEYGTQWNMLLTFAVVSVLPVIILFFIMQKYIVSGVTMGSVKG